MSPHPFDRYGSVTNLKELLAFSSMPLRKSMRVNMLKSSVSAFRDWAAMKGWTLQPVPWCPEGFFVDRVDREEALGKDVLHILGHTYIQEAASMLPVALLNPQPGDAVLDMSAAPGSKTTHILSRIGMRGIVVANDVQEKRLWALVTNLQRSSTMNVLVTRKVGQWFAHNMTERFDRVLCDAPCTAQGTARKDSTALQYCSPDNIGKMAKLQRELLESAIHAAKVGGCIVYSTCTLTPEENEDVVWSMLKKFPHQLEVISPLSFTTDNDSPASSLSAAREDSQAVQEMLGVPPMERFPSIRLWPQTYDTEGFFCAVFMKRNPTLHSEKRAANNFFSSTMLPDARRKSIEDALFDWYGTSFLESGDRLLSVREQLLVTTQETAEFSLPIPPYSVGMPFGKPVREGIARISQEMMTLRGASSTRQRAVLSMSQLRVLLRGGNVSLQESSLKNGDVVLLLDAHEGAGAHTPCLLPLCRGLHKDGAVLNRLPREIVQMYT